MNPCMIFIFFDFDIEPDHDYVMGPMSKFFIKGGMNKYWASELNLWFQFHKTFFST
jgi:hypothetical protein